MNTPKDAIVLAVGVEGVGGALAFAIDEASRNHRPLHLVHVLRLPAGEAYAGVYGGALDVANATLADALKAAEELADGLVSVSGEVVDNGWVVDDLARGTRGAAMVVLQHRALGAVHRFFTGSVVAGVAGRAAVPVVSVMEKWTPSEQHRQTVVTAAVQDPKEAGHLLRIAFREAQQRHGRVVVLHAWWLASGFDTMVVDQPVRDEWSARSRAELQPVLDEVTAEFPEVELAVHIRHAPPLEAVLDAAQASDLLVIGRRHHLLPLGSHLGPVARGVLAHSETPVLVTPEAATSGEPGAAGVALATSGR